MYTYCNVQNICLNNLSLYVRFNFENVRRHTSKLFKQIFRTLKMCKKFLGLTLLFIISISTRCLIICAVDITSINN
jgi:hypothetical protein